MDKIVFVKLYYKHWPAIVLSENQVAHRIRPNYVWVFWFGDHRISEVKSQSILKFETLFINEAKLFNNGGKKWLEGLYEAIKAYGHPLTENWTNQQLKIWALCGFKSSEQSPKRCLPVFVLEKLHEIKNTRINNPLESVKNEGVLEKMRYKIGDYCVGCYSTNIVDKHPLFAGGICQFCKDKFLSSFFNIGSDGIHQCCLFCGNFGDMIVCSSDTCGRSYCHKCVENLSSPESRMEILSFHIWYCFFCSQQMYGIIRIRSDWRILLNRHFQNGFTPIPTIFAEKKKIRVLSLFDGISSGLVALKKCNVQVEVYYASEIDENAMMVSKKRHVNEIKYIGDIKKVDVKTLENIGSIDLLIGGSPCNDLSLANPDRKGLFDPEGTGILFLEFYRIFTELRRMNGKHFFWLFENVASMTGESKQTITRFLQANPAKINASWVSAQNRERYFWGNLPSLKQDFENEGPKLEEYLQPGRKAVVLKIDTVTTRTNSLLQGREADCPVVDALGNPSRLTIEEIEAIFGFNRNYTKTSNFSDMTRLQLIGKAWSVQVACLLFQFLKYYFLVEGDY